MIKDIHSLYMPGWRGRWWAEAEARAGHAGRGGDCSRVWSRQARPRAERLHVRSAQGRGELVNIGKAYSGLTDVEIAELTAWFLGHTTADRGHLREVEPKIVLEVAPNAIMRSDRHDSGHVPALSMNRTRSAKTKPPKEDQHGG